MLDAYVQINTGVSACHIYLHVRAEYISRMHRIALLRQCLRKLVCAKAIANTYWQTMALHEISIEKRPILSYILIKLIQKTL